MLGTVYDSSLEGKDAPPVTKASYALYPQTGKTGVWLVVRNAPGSAQLTWKVTTEQRDTAQEFMGLLAKGKSVNEAQFDIWCDGRTISATLSSEQGS